MPTPEEIAAKYGGVKSNTDIAAKYGGVKKEVSEGEQSATLGGTVRAMGRQAKEHFSSTGGEIAQGARDVWSGEGFDSKVGGVSKVLRGAGGMVAPAAIPIGLGLNPVGTVAALGTGLIGQKVGEKVAEFVGAGPGVSNLAGDALGLAAGARFGKMSLPEGGFRLSDLKNIQAPSAGTMGSILASPFSHYHRAHAVKGIGEMFSPVREAVRNRRTTNLDAELRGFGTSSSEQSKYQVNPETDFPPRNYVDAPVEENVQSPLVNGQLPEGWAPVKHPDLVPKVESPKVYPSLEDLRRREVASPVESEVSLPDPGDMPTQGGVKKQALRFTPGRSKAGNVSRPKLAGRSNWHGLPPEEMPLEGEETAPVPSVAREATPGAGSTTATPGTSDVVSNPRLSRASIQKHLEGIERKTENVKAFASDAENKLTVRELEELKNDLTQADDPELYHKAKEKAKTMGKEVYAHAKQRGAPIPDSPYRSFSLDDIEMAIKHLKTQP